MKTIEEMIKKYPLLDTTAVLCLISTLAIASAAPIMYNVSNPYMLWTKQLMFYIIGFIACFVIFRLGRDTFYKHTKIIYWGFIVLLVLLGVDHQIYTRLHVSILPTAIVPHINGATSWIRLPGFQLQPSEFMKIFMVMYLAQMTHDYNENILISTTDSEIKYIIEVAKIAIPPAFLILLQNDSGVMLIFAASVFFILLSSGMNRNWFIFAFALIGAVVAFMSYLFVFNNGIFTSIITGHTLSRVYGWLDPEGTVSNQGMQLWYAQLSYGTAGWLGHGFRAVIKSFPEGQTDFIFALIATDFGYIGAFITLAAIVLFDLSILNIGLHSTSDRDRYFVMGIMGCLIFQQLWNIGMILGLLPITGITLPMLSYGGSSVLSYMIAIGILIDVDYSNKILDTSHKHY